MKRAFAAALVALVSLGVFTFAGSNPATAAPAQDATSCFPGSDPDYPPTGPAVSIQASLRLASAVFVPGGRGSIVIAGASANAVYCGRVFSNPVVLPAKQATAQGQLLYDIAVPRDFELGAMHHIDVFRQQVKVGNFDFCVDGKGRLAPTAACAGKRAAAGGPLARTGANGTLDIARIGLIALGVGVGALYLRRRRALAAS